MLVTCHWSATGPERLNDYHVEFAMKAVLLDGLHRDLYAATGPDKVDWDRLLGLFAVWKNVNFDTATDYGTWHMNHDPRDRGPNVQIGALCMGGEAVSVTEWGRWPFTIAHAWVMAAIVARICHLKGVDALGCFTPPVGFENGPLFNVSTHAERAYQTVNPGFDDTNHRGYGMFSGDPNLRWDLAVLDHADVGKLSRYETAKVAATASARWIRMQAQAIIDHGPLKPTLGLDVPA